jgi:tRNA threonylcarbamoyladenosine biosynthesis protein TsaE
MTARPIEVRLVGAEAADQVVAVVHAGFGAREVLDPPSTAPDESRDSVAVALAAHGGVLATAGPGAVGALIFEPDGELMWLRRVAVHPDAQRHGIARALVRRAEREAARRGAAGARVVARAELPRTVRFWRHLGYAETDRDGPFLTLAKALPVAVETRSADEARALGARLASVLRPGDLVILSGDLGAGKTTLTQGIGAGLRVRGDVTSPTFVISRVHPATGPGPALVHADAYRLGGVHELDDLDLDASLDEAVTVVEWGEGMAEALAGDRLELVIRRRRGRPANGSAPHGDEEDDPRHVRVSPVGRRWIGVDLRAAVHPG